jgi:hypothetical protein
VADQTNTPGDRQSNARQLGLASLAIGVIMATIFIGWPVYCALCRPPAGRRSMVGIAFTILFLQTGVNLLVFGAKAVDWIPADNTRVRDMGLMGWVVFLSNIAIAIVLYCWLRALLASLAQ